MTWVMVLGLALLAFVIAAFVLKAPRPGWEAIGATLLLGIAGYGLQAHPGMPGAPKPAQQRIVADTAALVDARGEVTESGIPQNNRWIIVADGLARNGQYANAAQVLRGALAEEPDNAEAWLALGNVLVAHADGMLTPAALHAFQKAADADPEHPGPPFFLGMALAQSGQLTQAREVWAELLARSPQDAPWRADLESRLEQLDRFIAGQQQPARPQP